MKYNPKEQIELYDEIYSSQSASYLYDKHLNETFFEISNRNYFFPKLFHTSLKDKDILDIGCGGGNIGTKIRDKVKCITNMDISFNALLHARRRIGSERSKYVQGNMLALPFKVTSFDIIICYAALHHIEDMDTVAKEIKQLLKDNGTFLCFEPAERYSWVDFWLNLFRIQKILASFIKNLYIKLQNKFAKQDKFLNVLKDLNRKSCVRHFFKTPAQYKEIFIRNGFIDVKIKTILIEFLPPRFFTYKNKVIVGWIFKLSDLFHRLGIAKEKGRFIIIEAHKA